MPKTNREYWRMKLMANVQRDKENVSRLVSIGWDVITVWECEINTDVDAVLNHIICKIIGMM
jgi:DNA mismatch endonuclease (patch repair protein)